MAIVLLMVLMFGWVRCIILEEKMINDIGGTNSANTAIKEGNLGKLEIHKVDRIIASALIGGTAWKLSGDKLANGALSGALAQMYNGEEASTSKVKDKILLDSTGLTQAQINEMSPADLPAYFGGTVITNDTGQSLYFGPESKMSKIFSQGKGAKTFKKFLYDKFNGTLNDGDNVDEYGYKFNRKRFFDTSNSAEHVIGSWEDGQAIVVQDQILFRVNNTMGVSSFFYGRYTDSWFGFSLGDKASDVNMMIEWTTPVRSKL